MKMVETSTSSFLKTTMGESIEETAKRIRQIVASNGQSQAVINANVVTETMKNGMANATKATNSNITKISAGSAMTTESIINVIQEQQ
jgi:hypothetical protein